MPDPDRPLQHNHTCRPASDCTCDHILGLEPDEHCPRHGAGPPHNQCEVCGKFVSRTLNLRGAEWFYGDPKVAQEPTPPHNNKERCGLSENSHLWIGDVCTNCGIVWSIWAARTINELHRQLKQKTNRINST